MTLFGERGDVIGSLWKRQDVQAFRRKALFGMKWIRSNIRHCARLVLMLLAVQLALSFGHFHAVSAQTSSAQTWTTGHFGPEHALPHHANNFLAVTAARNPIQPQSPPNHDSDQRPSDPCAICAVIVLANMLLFAKLPLLLPPLQAVEQPHLAMDAALVHLNTTSGASRPRAPPFS